MKIKAFIFYFFFTCIIVIAGKAQANKPAPDSLLIGTWKGSSICQIKDSPCHDETVVYHITKHPGTDTFNVLMNKIVKDKEEEMGILPCTYNNKTRQLLSTAYSGTWTFRLDKGKLKGTLFFRGYLYRVINITKMN
jgi:hypothetical protein